MPKKLTRNQWLERFKSHNHKNILYDKIPEKILSTDKLTFTCLIHGDFEQQAISHSRGFSCKKCADNVYSEPKNRAFSRGWSFSRWRLAAEKSKNFDSFKVYIIRCYNKNEEFYKIGKTFTTIKQRFRDKKRLPYNYEVIKVFINDYETISRLENKLHRKFKKYKYTPNLKFKGSNECFKR